LLWPRSISARLSDEQIEAIFAHELAHVRRRDNLAAATHMLVQAVFWFHPLVWWIGARLIDERERACDEEVISRGSEPLVYAESILKTCEFYIESPLACVSGVTGSDLRKRIEQIMRSEGGSALSAWRKALLAIVGVMAIGTPVLVGMLNAPLLRAQSAAGGPKFEVASIKVNKSGNAGGGSRVEPGGRFTATNLTLRALIGNAYGAPLQPLLNNQLVGGPDWLDSEHFDIVAKAEGNVPPGPDSPLPLMIRALLAERFNLAVHNETRALPIYALVMARSDRRIGEQMKPAAIDCSARGRGNPPPAPAAPGERPACGIRFLIGNMAAGGVTMAQFASALSRFVGRPVVEKTGLSGEFDIDLKWTPDRLPPASAGGAPFQPPVDPDGPSIFTAVQEQLGLKLDAQNGPVDVLVIDRVERLNAEDEFVSPAPPPLPPPPPQRR
jgi:bla regulator protein blaR1